MKQNTKKMGRKKAVVLLVILCVLIALTSILTFVPFNYGEDGIMKYNSVAGAIKLGIDLKGGVYVVMQPKTTGLSEEETNEVYKKLFDNMEGIITILRNRLTNKGYSEATVVAQQEIGSARQKIRIEIPDVSDPEEVFSIIGQQGVLEFRNGSKVIFTGDNIKSAYPMYEDNDANKPAVGVTIDKIAQKAFAKATEELAASSGKIGIYLDDQMISEPSVSKLIDSSSFIITGMESYETAKDRAMLIQSGSLGIEFEQIEPRTLSSQLGQDAINMGLLAGAIGLGLVLLFMAIYYRGFGLCADLALLVFIVLFMLLLSQLPWVQLTLPGIAGIILSIGMAVDANVIIFESIKDEYKMGKTLRAAVKSGFQRATMAIVDSNATTLIISAILWLLGTGSIQGFAVTLFIGILVSFFTCMVVTRLFINIFLSLNESGEKFYGIKKEEAAHE